MKYTLYHFRRIQGAWFNRGAAAFAATKREARQTSTPRGYPSGEDHIYCWLKSDTAPNQAGCGPCGSFPLASAV